MGGNRRQIGLVHVADIDVAPQADEPRDSVAEAVGMDRQRRRVDRPGRGSADDVERCRRRFENARNGAQRANLISGTRTATGQNDAGRGRRRCDRRQGYSERKVRSRIRSIAAVAPQM
jgi:hypothetical protein